MSNSHFAAFWVPERAWSSKSLPVYRGKVMNVFRQYVDTTAGFEIVFENSRATFTSHPTAHFNISQFVAGRR